MNAAPGNSPPSIVSHSHPLIPVTAPHTCSYSKPTAEEDDACSAPSMCPTSRCSWLTRTSSACCDAAAWAAAASLRGSSGAASGTQCCTKMWAWWSCCWIACRQQMQHKMYTICLYLAQCIYQILYISVVAAACQVVTQGDVGQHPAMHWLESSLPQVSRMSSGLQLQCFVS